MSLALLSVATIQQFMLKLILCAAEWSLFTYVTGIRPRFYKVGFLIGLHMVLSFFLTPYIGEVTVGLLLYFAIISYKMPKSRLVENFFFALYPPVLFSILWNFMARIVFPFLFNHPLSYFLDSFVWSMTILIAVTIFERFLREFYQIDYIAMKNSTWLDKRTQSNFWVTLSEMLSYFILYYFLVFMQRLHVGKLLGIPVSVLIIVVTVVYLAVLMKVLILIDYYSREYLKDLRRTEQKHYLENLESYSQQIEELYQSVRSFRHDYNNILLSLKGSIESGDLNLVTRVFDEIFQENIAGLDSRDRQAKLINIMMPEIKSFLFIKIGEFESQNYKLVLNIPDIIMDCGVSSSAGLTIFSEMFDRVMPWLEENPAALVNVRIIEENGVQSFSLEFTPYQQTDLNQLADLSIESRRNLNHYRKLTFAQGVHDQTFYQELRVRREPDR